MQIELTPLDVLRRSFPKKLRGYDPEEVDTFMREVADTLERISTRVANLENKLVSLEAENVDHREREQLVRDTMVTAQKTAEEIRRNARRDGEVIISQAEMRGEQLTEQARRRAGDIERSIDELRLERRRLHSKLEHTLDLFRQTLDFDREQEESDGMVVAFHKDVEAAAE